MLSFPKDIINFQGFLSMASNQLEHVSGKSLKEYHELICFVVDNDFDSTYFNANLNLIYGVVEISNSQVGFIGSTGLIENLPDNVEIYGIIHGNN